MIPLQFTDAIETAKIVAQVYEQSPDYHGVRVVPAPRVNALIVIGPKQALAAVREMVELLDKQTVEREEVQLFPLANIEPDEDLLGVLMTVVDGRTRVSLDPQRHAVIAAGSPSSLNVIEALLLRLDQPSEVEPGASGADNNTLQVRLVWLVADGEKETTAQAPSDLKNVVREMEKIGMTDLRMVAQVVVNATLDQTFVVEGSAKLEEPCHLSVSGTIGAAHRIGLAGGAQTLRVTGGGSGHSAMTTRQGPARARALGKHPAVELQISAAGDGGETRLCELETTIRAPLGQSVVLGVTPINSRPSIFVLQVTPNTGSGSSK